MAALSRLPATSADEWEWQYSGLCRDADAMLFFHPESERGPARRYRDAAAVAVCAPCPVRERCRQHALTVREPYGVWGGLTESARESLHRLDRAQTETQRAVCS